jgi:hypothetical protein
VRDAKRLFLIVAIAASPRVEFDAEPFQRSRLCAVRNRRKSASPGKPDAETVRPEASTWPRSETEP